MSATEIATITRQYQERIAAILSPAELAAFDTYQRRIEQSIARRASAPVVPSPAEQAALDIIAADRQAAALRTQLDILLRLDTPPQ
jgi:hypothetical protein